MEPSERDRLTQETHQALLGIKGTEDKGLVGDVKEIKSELKSVGKKVDGHALAINTLQITQNERGKPNKKTLGGVGAGVVAIALALWKAFTN